MIRLRQPALVMHAHDVPGYKYTMSTVRALPKATKPLDVINWIKLARKECDGFALYNIVINCHGNPGIMYTGDTPIDSSNVGVFSKVGEPHFKDIYTIWIVACQVASGTDGYNFCSNLAKAAGCNVVAADKNQYVNRPRFPYGCIDNYEGHAYIWRPTGIRESIRRNAKGVPGVE